MDFNNFKEELKNIINNVYSYIINSAAFYFIKEKYDHLSVLNRKIIQISCFIILLCVLLYYPTSHIYSSWKKRRDANTKQTLIRELMRLSPNRKNNISSSYLPGQDPLKFIQQRIPVLQIPKKQIQKIKKVKEIQKSSLLKAKVETVIVEVQNLNLKEVVEYGYKLEKLSNNIKLNHLRIKENPNKNDYFNVSYALSFFSPITDTILDKTPQKPKLKLKKEPPPTDIKEPSPTVFSNDKIFDNLKTPSPPKPSPPPTKFLNQQKKTEKELPLMEIKKADIKEDSHFENRPEEVKKRDLLPALPMPKPKKDK